MRGTYEQRRRAFVRWMTNHVTRGAANWDVLKTTAFEMGFTEDQATAIVSDVSQTLWRDAAATLSPSDSTSDLHSAP